MDDPPREKPPILLLDTNVWLTRQFLMPNTPLAASLLLSLQRRKGYLAMPEVLELEIKKQVGRVAAEAAQRFDDVSATLDTLGVRQVQDPPYEITQVQAVAAKRLDDLESLLVRMPMTLDQTQRALRRVNAELPPNGPKNQQFKDSLLWEAAVDLSVEYALTFVTGDKGFFEGNDPSAGAAKGLREDVASHDIVLMPLQRIDDLLAQLKEGLTEVTFERLKALVLSSIMPRIETTGKAYSFKLGKRIEDRIEAYLTPEPNRLAIEFRFEYEMTKRRKRRMVPGRYSIDGSCSYLPDADELDSVAVHNESMVPDARDETGESIRGVWSLRREYPVTIRRLSL